MYNGEIIEDLIEMVARAESRAAQRIVAAPEPVEIYAPHFFYEVPATQPALIGVA